MKKRPNLCEWCILENTNKNDWLVCQFCLRNIKVIIPKDYYKTIKEKSRG